MKFPRLMPVPARPALPFLLPFLLLLLSFGSRPASGFYLPGVAPTSYKPGDAVPLYVNSIRPAAPRQGERLRAVVSYDYYHPPFQFCRPEDGPPRPVGESLGSILFGDRIMTSPFDLRMRVNETCKRLCQVSYPARGLAYLRSKVELGYSLRWLVDGLPAGQEMEDVLTKTRFYSPGFMLGRLDGDRAELNNHYEIAVEYHEVDGDPDGRLRVVGVTVQPASIDYAETGQSDGGGIDCRESDHGPVMLDVSQGKGAGGGQAGAGQGRDVTFSYSVYWIKSPTAWATRWDKYLHVFDPKIHWFWLVDTAVVVVILVLTVSSILVRTLKRDIARYNRLDQISMDDLGPSMDQDDDDGIQEDSGWKLVHGDVFRPPPRRLLLAILVGNGAQVVAMTAITMAFALFGFVSPSNRGSLGSIMVVLHTFLGCVGGFVSARVYRTWQGDRWRALAILTPLAVPAAVFGAVLFLNLFLWAKQSAGAVPFTTLLLLVAMWFLISVPLSLAGAWLGFRQPGPIFPVRTNQIPRQIPPAPTYLRPLPSMLAVGLLPFGAIFVELYFIMSSIWFSRIYYMFGFLFLCYGLMIITCAATTVLMVYFLLCAENYHWQWRSFLAAGMSGGYVFANCLLYLASKLHLGGFAGVVLYIGYSALLSFLFFILTGTIGYFSAWWFVGKIYGSLKVD